MTKASWGGNVIAESPATIVVEGNHYFPPESIRREHFKPSETTNELRDEFGERVTVVVIPDASHALIPEQPAAVVEAIVRWMRKLPR